MKQEAWNMLEFGCDECSDAKLTTHNKETAIVVSDVEQLHTAIGYVIANIESYREANINSIMTPVEFANECKCLTMLEKNGETIFYDGRHCPNDLPSSPQYDESNTLEMLAVGADSVETTGYQILYKRTKGEIVFATSNDFLRVIGWCVMHSDQLRNIQSLEEFVMNLGVLFFNNSTLSEDCDWLNNIRRSQLSCSFNK